MKDKKPTDYYFDVFVTKPVEMDFAPSIIALSEDGVVLDDSLGSHNLSQSVIDALNNAGIFGDSELMESIWEVCDYETKTLDDIISSMENEGFKYKPGFLGQ